MRPAALLVCAVLYATTTGIAVAGEETIQLKDGEGRALTAARCAICHSLDYIQMNAAVISRPEWEKSIRKMIDRFGAPVSEDEAHRILEYLAQQY
jgi:sulfite dehydrogenase (cytochrome) subunit B